MNPEITSIHVVPTLEAIAAKTPSAQHAQATTWTANVLLTAMNDGALTPGTKLSEQRIAEKLDISRNTLRQAFMILVEQNLLEQIPNRGVFVRVPDAEQIQEMFTVRLALESTAIEQAPSGESDVFRSIMQRSVRSRQLGSVSGMADANQDFHRELVHLARSPRLDYLMSSVLAEMRLLFFSMVTMPSFHARFVDLNQELLHLIEKGEKERAQKFLREYLQLSQESFTQRLEAWE
ncbi:GntR family transcriptional regulator [uncultured Rothia sp.]|uniref:GntR family transcriptional regulator n=1 Tax=uncultured Rothia sp. TaxID=316088 RepID=UPI003216748C